MDEDVNQQLAQAQIEALKKQLFMRMLTKDARRRLANIKTANPSFASQLELALIQVLQTGRIQLIDEKTLITLIKQLRGKHQETKIIRR